MILRITLAVAAAIALPAAGPSPARGQQMEPVVITCLGDSVTHSYPYGAGDPLEDEDATYAGSMAALLNASFPSRGFEVHNRGVNGYKAEHVRSLLQTEGLPENPAFVLLMIGGNDIAEAMSDWGKIGQIIDQTVSEVQECVTLVKSHTNPDGSHPALIVSTFIPNRLEESAFFGSLGTLGIKWYNDALESDLTGQDLLMETNWQALWQSYGLYGRANPALMYDSVHPNSSGYALMAENWSQALATFPALTDSDSDGLFDADETGLYGTSAQSADSDGDGWSDLLEVACAGAAAATNPVLSPSSVFINFQPPHVPVPAGSAADRGRPFSASIGFGW